MEVKKNKPVNRTKFNRETNFDGMVIDRQKRQPKAKEVKRKFK